jgi:hypothetical protein
LTVTFQVLVKCPGPLPVQFTVGYDVGGQHAVATLPGFPDLSQVPYKGCPANAGPSARGGMDAGRAAPGTSRKERTSGR